MVTTQNETPPPHHETRQETAKNKAVHKGQTQRPVLGWGGLDKEKDTEMSKRLYNKIAYRLVKVEKQLAELSMLMDELDGGLASDIGALVDGIATVYEVLDERRDNGEYPSLLLP